MKALTWSFPERLLAAVCASAVLLFAVDLTFPEREAAVYDRVIRLHILADSDSEADQALKYAVRDAVVSECSDLFADAGSTEDALERIEAASSRMEEVARRVLAEKGSACPVKTVFGAETYPAREYDGVIFPAGTYYSLRIVLGKGEGRNWWCCLFPPLCLSSASAEEAFGSVGIDTSSGKVFTKKRYAFRLKLLEWFSCLFE